MQENISGCFFPEHSVYIDQRHSNDAQCFCWCLIIGKHMWNLPAKNWHSGENIQYLTSYCKVITNNSLCKYMQLKLVLTDLMVDAEWALRSKNHAMMNLKENSKNEFITRKPTLTNPHCCCWWWSMMMMILHGLCPKKRANFGKVYFRQAWTDFDNFG